MMAWLVRRLQPGEGWTGLLLMLLTVLCLPATALAAEWVPDDDGLVILALFALLVGRWLALREGWRWGMWLLVGTSHGFLAALCTAAHTWPLLPRSSELASDFARRWLNWLEAALSGGANDDPDIFLFYMALLCWVAVLFAAWAFYRRQNPLLALTPPVLLTALVVFYSGDGIQWLILELGGMIVLLALGNLTYVQRTWETRGMDYAFGLSFDVLSVAGIIAFAVACFSFLGPQFSIRRLTVWFWRTFREPSAQVEETMDRLFGGVSLSGGADGFGSESVPGASSYLPQSRLLGGRPNLLEEVVMLVWTDEPPPPPPLDDYIPAEVRSVLHHYWRGGTMDYYSGRGWATTVDSRKEVSGTLPLSPPPDYREVTQRFEFVAPHGNTLYAMNTPSWVGEPVEVLWRGPGDLAMFVSETVSYTVRSYLPAPTADNLQSVSSFYPPMIREHYLQLPETVPSRVVDLAREVVAEGESVYEQARLLERYLRTYPYSLDVARPPEGRDVVDYFLFGAREGYCDYYATAFVVMARIVGIPARLASGYIGGQYDYDSRVYKVRQDNAHSWPEVYFPGWGWIGFEPTAVREITVLPEELPLPAETLPGPTGPPARVIRSKWRVVGLRLAILVGAWLVVVVWRRYRRRQAALPTTLPLAWSWVGQRGGGLGVPLDPALTPQEYAGALAIELRARAERTRRWRTRWIKLATQGGEALEQLATLYTSQTYGGQRAQAVSKGALREVWTRLHRPLRWFRWLGRGRRKR
jgi:transglutaminase-like putative cysteine protease